MKVLATPMYKDKNKCHIYLIVGLDMDNAQPWFIKTVMYRPFNMKKWRDLREEIEDDFEYRVLDRDTKKMELNRRFLEFVGEEKINEAFEYAWKALRPKLKDWKVVLGL